MTPTNLEANASRSRKMLDFDKTICNIAEYLCKPANRGILENLIAESRFQYETEALEGMDYANIKRVCINKFSKGCLAE
jgi:hypothetical protein